MADGLTHNWCTVCLWAGLVVQINLLLLILAVVSMCYKIECIKDYCILSPKRLSQYDLAHETTHSLLTCYLTILLLYHIYYKVSWSPGIALWLSCKTFLLSFQLPWQLCKPVIIINYVLLCISYNRARYLRPMFIRTTRINGLLCASNGRPSVSGISQYDSVQVSYMWLCYILS